MIGTAEMWLERAAAAVKRFFRRRDGGEGHNRLVVTDTGFRLEGEEGVREVEWPQVRRIVAFKVDLLTTDVICLEFQLGEGALLVSEDRDGFADLLQALFALPLRDPSWYVNIMTPVFEPTPTVIYDADDPAPPSGPSATGEA